eukprot:635422-Alexandrium_andersonii.AAC.1
MPSASGCHAEGRHPGKANSEAREAAPGIRPTRHVKLLSGPGAHHATVSRLCWRPPGDLWRSAKEP